MKFIYNNTKYEIIVDDFISVYHLRKLIEKKYGFIIDDSYSITDLDGKIYKPDGTVIKNDEIVVLKKKLIGGAEFNPNDTDISSGLMNPMAFITAIVSGFYYFKYVSGIIVEKNIEYKIFQVYTNIEENKKHIGGVVPTIQLEPLSTVNQIQSILDKKNINITEEQIASSIKKYNITSKNPKNIANKLANEMEKNGKTNTVSPSSFKEFLNSFIEGLRDNQFEKINCAFKKNFPEQELNRDYDNTSNWNMIATSAIFFTYFLTILIALFINPVSTKYCGTPNGGIGVFTFVMLFIPLVLVFIIPYIIKGLNFLFVNIFHLQVDISKYKLTTSNIILIVMLIFYCVTNINGISPMFGMMIPVFMLVFAIIDFILKKTKVLRILSRFLGNLITNTEKITKDSPEMFNSEDIRPSHKITSKENYQAPECYYRFNIFHSLFYGVIASIIGRGFFSSVYSANIKYCCPK